MSKNKTAVADHAETLTRVKGMVLSRERSVHEVNSLFANAKPERKKDVEKMNKLLIQAPAAQIQTPNLQKEAVAKNVTAYFEKKAYLTEAQRRYPELQKVANTETTSQVAPMKKPAGKVATKSLLSGGQH